MRSLFASVAFCASLLACTAPNAPPPSVASNTRYLALGDSFTAGTGSTPNQSFPARLVARWSSAGCAAPLTNLGVNGYTTADVLEEEVPELSRAAPQIVTLAIGANDIVQGVTTALYRDHVHQILAAVVAAGVKRIVAIPQPDWALSPTAADFGSPAALHARIVELDGVLRAETQAVGGTYVDLSPLMEREATAQMLAPDALHPSAAAYDAWSEALSRVLPPPCAAQASNM
jgi:lysophospholipase L1-like esterase